MLLRRRTPFYILILISFIATALCQRCGQRDEVAAGRECKTPCESDGTCRSKNKVCVCDGLCGLSCLRKNTKCDENDLHANHLEIEFTYPDGYSRSERLARMKPTGTIARFSCTNSGYSVTGPDLKVCGDGEWRVLEPSCEREINQECEERDEVAAGRRCSRACQPDGTCGTWRRECVCDGLCGLSCLRKVDKIADKYPCHFRGNFLTHGESRNLDPCVECTCQNGTTTCNIESCPSEARCEPYEIAVIEEECCPQCAYTPNRWCQRRNEREAGRNCKKACLADGTCGKRNKVCVCDGLCGFSCFRTETCDENDLHLNEWQIEFTYPRGSSVDDRLARMKPAGTIARLRCRDVGYNIVGFNAKVCRDGQWNVSEPTCETFVQSCYPRDEVAAGRICQKACRRDGTCRDGNRECICDGRCGLSCLKKRKPCTCRIWGGPHHWSFDGGVFTFNGDCEYILSQHTHEQSLESGLQSFKLVARYHKRRPDDRVTYVSYIRLEHNRKDFKLHNRQLFINGTLMLTPYTSDGVSVTLRPDNALILEADFGLVVEFKGFSATVSLHTEYSEQVNGLCGNCDGDGSNECARNDDNKAVMSCASQWAALDDCKTVGPYDGCLENPSNRQKAKDLCGMMTNSSGPFAACNHAVELLSFTKACEYDLCTTLPNESLLCDHFDNLAGVCRQEGVLVENWRAEIPHCRKRCPYGTTYNPCGSACPSTCGNQKTENVKCGPVCAELCECPEGKVIANGMCVAQNACACQLPNGSYLPSGDTFYNNDCSQLCTCVSGQLSCQIAGCHGKAKCLQRGGVRRCYCKKGFEGDGVFCQPKSVCRCSAWGNLHYNTFNGQTYEFQGDCEYTFVKSCRHSRKPKFELVGTLLKISPAHKVSFVRQIKLHFKRYVYELLQNGVVFINRTRVLLPYEDENGVHIAKPGNLVLYTEFGLTVIWDNSGRVTVTLRKAAYFNNTCGLCGTCNDVRFDDFLTREGRLTSNAIEFGSSWKTGNRQCLDQLETFSCSAGKDAEKNAKSSCHALIDPLGALAVCHEFLDPKVFYETCVHDVCAGVDDSILCNNMEEYVEECAAVGGNPSLWWKDRPECEPECPVDAFPVSNATGCPPTCAQPNSDPNCPLESMAVCQCHAPLVLDGNKCVSNCTGCQLQSGRYLQNGEMVVKKDCSETCTCVNATLQCWSRTCSPYAECVVRAGVRDCVCKDGFEGDGLSCKEAPFECTVWGDAHYITFDGSRLDLEGDCEYILVERCPTEDEEDSLLNYRVVVNHVKDYPSAAASFARSVRLEANGQSYKIISGGLVYINGTREPLPYNDSIVSIQTVFPDQVVMETSFQLSVTFENPYTVRVKLYQKEHSFKTCGVCGTLNATSVVDFGNAWATDARECVPDTVESACEDLSESKLQALNLCSTLTSIVGPFTTCHDLVDPNPIFSTCTNDVCVIPNKHEALCNNLQVYAKKCKSAGGSPGEWWNRVPECDSLCPEGMVYDPCGSPCQTTCSGLGENDCQNSCEEVCRCPDGKFLDGEICVRESECGCKLQNGGYLRVNEEWFNKDCSRRCSCTETGLECESYVCRGSSSCDVKNGIRKCYCSAQQQMKDNLCQTAPYVCNVFGDGHYSTFDKFTYDYQSDCEYILVQKCVESESVPDYKLIGLHKKAPGDKVSHLKYIKLEYAENTFEIFINMRVTVNGREVNLPYVDEEIGLTVESKVFGYTTISIDFGLFIMYDELQSATIYLQPQHVGTTCGLCGTCTGTIDDELTLPDGQITKSPMEFGDAWRNDNFCETERVTEDPCVTGSDGDQMGKNLCHPLIRQDGPFTTCADTIDPQYFHDSCVKDTCVSKNKAFSCHTMELYARQCRQLGGFPGERWSQSPKCLPTAQEPVGCPDGSFSSAVFLNNENVSDDLKCPPTCSDPDGGKCPVLVETCICERSGSQNVFHNGICIPKSNCGCICENEYIEIGQSGTTKNCVKYTCIESNGNKQCVPSDCECHEHASCVEKGGNYECYCNDGYEEVEEEDGCLTCVKEEKFKCRLSGDPHIMSFDGKFFDYQGACEYILVETCGSGMRLDEFKLIGNFKNRDPGRPVTRVVSLRLEYRNFVYELKGPGGTFVNGVPVKPQYEKNGVQIFFPSRKRWTLKTDFGLFVDSTFELWNSLNYANLFVTLPRKFRDRTCGLCGTATDTREDDFLLPNGEITDDVNEFGNAWQTGDSRCLPAEGPDSCPKGSDLHLAATYICSVIIDKFGLLDGCRDFVNPEQFYDDCVYDVCLTNLETDHLCRNIDAFVRLCRQKRGNPGKWWKYVPECASECPDGQEYNDCGTGCPPNCKYPQGVENCPESCIETCECPEGQVLDGETCTFLYNCGCTLDDGVYISQGDVYTYEDCSVRCTCGINGEEHCVPLGCQRDEECKVVGEQRGCFCGEGFGWDGRECIREPCRCRVWGDPHYFSFDGRKYDFEGDCEYTLVESCNQGDLPYFRIIGSNYKDVPSSPVSYLRRVRLEYLNFEYEIFSSGEVKVGNVSQTLPLTTGGSQFVTITYIPPGKILLITHFGVQVLYSFTRSSLVIEISSNYYEKLCGMCGTCNQDITDEFLIPSNELVSSTVNFGNGWRTGRRECSPGPGRDPCLTDPQAQSKAERLCFIIKNAGPFEICHEFVDSTPFYESCVYDMCVTKQVNSYCNALYEYSEACRLAGGNPGTWWEEIRECAAPCPDDMIYIPDGVECPQTCSTRNQEVTCNIKGIDMCSCPEGKILDGQKCVYPRECGCNTPEGTYISPGAVFVNEDCSQHCTCTLGHLECEDFSCHDLASCEIRSGKRDCYCSNGYIGDGQLCKQSDCECFIWTDLHIRTFDHVIYTHNVGCEYTLLRGVPLGSNFASFDLIGSFDREQFSLINALRLELEYSTYEILRNGELFGNGSRLIDGVDKSILYRDDKISYSYLPGESMILVTQFGLSIHYSLRALVSIKVTSKWRGRVSGMCGTCNNNDDDEFTLDDGTQTNDILAFAESWKVRPACGVRVPEGFEGPETCGELATEAKDRCYPLIDPNGAFSICHDFVNPTKHYKTCINDYCQERNYVCHNFASYAAQCRASGGTINDWRAVIDECPSLCPQQYQYLPCASSCVPTCLDLKAQAITNCPHNCIETCSCMYGTVVKNASCVTPRQCDCYLEEVGILAAGVTFINEDCTKRCECVDKVVQCDYSYSCSPYATCGMMNGKHGCYCNEGFEGDGLICNRPADCMDILLREGHTQNGVYRIYPVDFPIGFRDVYCDMTTDGGGWIVFQKKFDFSVDFNNRGWNEYKSGFGSFEGEFWLGNEDLHYITNQKDYNLRIDLVDDFGQSSFSFYELFSIASERENYRMHWEGQSGTVLMNGLMSHNGMSFTTRDRDNDNNEDENCAEFGQGGWWYNACFFSNLNSQSDEHFFWLPFTLSSSEMKIRPRE